MKDIEVKNDCDDVVYNTINELAAIIEQNLQNNRKPLTLRLWCCRNRSDFSCDKRWTWHAFEMEIDTKKKETIGLIKRNSLYVVILAVLEWSRIKVVEE